jgi:hypothetical protein
MKNNRVLTIGYTDYLLPEDMTSHQIADLIAMLASLAVIDSTGREIAGKWTQVHYLDGIRVVYQQRSHREAFDNREQAGKHLDYLELQAAQPETVGDAF